MHDDVGKNCNQPSVHSSVGRFGRIVFGTMSLICALGFGAYAWFLWFAKPAGWNRILLTELLFDGMLFTSVFMLLVTASFWSPGSIRTDRLVARRLSRAYPLIMIFAIGICSLTILKLMIR